MSWHKQAACLGLPSDIFFGDEDHGLRGNAKQAKSICANCPVREKCLDENIFEEHGIFGGMTIRERADERTRRGLRKPIQLSPHGTSARARWHYRNNVPICEPCLRAQAVAEWDSRERRGTLAR